MNVCVVVLNWNNGHDTIECLESLLTRIDLPTSIVVCDNASTDGSFKFIDDWLKIRSLSVEECCVNESKSITCSPGQSIHRSFQMPIITLISTGANLGYAGGNNVGIRYALKVHKFDYLLVLNNDTIVTEGALQAMSDRLDTGTDLGICGAKIVYFHSPEHVQAWGGAAYSPMLGRAVHLGAGAAVGISPDPKLIESKTNYILGAAMMVSHKFLDDVGFMSEDYFLYYEEIDWSTRGRQKGYKLCYAPTAVILHKEGASIGSSRERNKRSLLSDYYLISSRIKFTRKFYPWFLLTVLLFTLLQMARVLLHGDHVRFKTMWHAIIKVPYAKNI